MQTSPESKYLYIVLTHPHSIVSSIIHSVTKEQYTHSSLAFSPELTPMFTFARKYSRFPFWGTYKKETLIDRFYKKNPDIPGRIIAIPVTSEQYKFAQERVESFWNNRSRLKYNNIGLFLNAIGVAYDRPEHYTCSQFVSETLSKAGVCDFDSPFSLIRPIDLLSVDGTVIFEGDLKKYSPTSTPVGSIS